MARLRSFYTGFCRYPVLTHGAIGCPTWSHKKIDPPLLLKVSIREGNHGGEAVFGGGKDSKRWVLFFPEVRLTDKTTD